MPKLRVKGGGGPVGLQFDPDLSVRWKEHLVLHSYSASDLVTFNPERPLVFEANVGDVRALRMDDNKRFYVAYTPMDDEPFGCAHVSVLMLMKSNDKAAISSFKSDLSSLFKVSFGEATVKAPEGA